MNHKLAGRFGLIEAFVMIIIITIFGLIVIPHMLSARQKEAREVELEQTLESLQTAVDRFYAMHRDYPPNLNQLVCPPKDWPSDWSSDHLVNLGSWQAFPFDPVAKENQVPSSPIAHLRHPEHGYEIGNTNLGWEYDQATGEVRPASTLLDSRGAKYNTWSARKRKSRAS